MRLPIYLSKQHLKNCHQYMIIITNACYVYSGSWVAIEILSYFHTGFEQWSRGNLWLLFSIFLSGLSLGFVLFLRKCAAMLSMGHRLEGQDISIEIRVGDVFDEDGAYIISSSTLFNTDLSNRQSSPQTLQWQFINKFYDIEEHFEHELTKVLKEEDCEDDENLVEKQRYEIGKVIKVSPREQVAYFIAIDELNEHSGVESSLDNVREGLSNLWYYIGTQGTLVPLVIPVIGTGHCGIPVSREQMILERIS